MNGMFGYMIKYLDLIQVQTLTRTHQNFNFIVVLIVFNSSEVDLLMCFGSLSCCIAQVHFSFRAQTDVKKF